jgi:hypothetical protein
MIFIIIINYSLYFILFVYFNLLGFVLYVLVNYYIWIVFIFMLLLRDKEYCYYIFYYCSIQIIYCFICLNMISLSNVHHVLYTFLCYVICYDNLIILFFFSLSAVSNYGSNLYRKGTVSCNRLLGSGRRYRGYCHQYVLWLYQGFFYILGTIYSKIFLMWSINWKNWSYLIK